VGTCARKTFVAQTYLPSAAETQRTPAHGEEEETPVLDPNLTSANFAVYVNALEKLRVTLDGGQRLALDTETFVFVLRPFFWHIHELGFQDVYDESRSVFAILGKHRNAIDPYDYRGLTSFIRGYVNDGSYDGSGFVYVAGSVEVAAVVALENAARALEGVGAPSEEVAALTAYARLLQRMEGSHHTCYWVLRHIGVDHIKELFGLTVTLAPVYQSYILHALDEFVGNKDVADFYERYIAQSAGILRSEAQRYLRTVAA
jgi:hypothetical protein